MNITISENLKDLRNKKRNTQEELAAYLAISFQAVSKWERDEAYPDITLLPKIAAYYNVSVDDLLGVGKIREKEKIEEYDNKCQKLSKLGDIDNEVILYREAANEFPNNLNVLHSLMSALWNQNKRGNDPNQNADEIIKIGERLLKETVEDDWLRYSAVQVLCFIYVRIDNKEKAKEYAYKAPTYYVTFHELVARALDGEEALVQIQRNVMDLIDLIELNICQNLINKYEFNNDEKRYLNNFVLNLYKLLFSDGDFGFYYDRTYRCYYSLAVCNAIDNNLEGTIQNLKLSTEHAIKFDTLESGKSYTSFLVNRHTYGKGTPNSYDNCSYDILNKMQNERYDFCRDDERFKLIKEELQKYAKSNK